MEDAILADKLPSIDGVLCGNHNVGIDRVDYVSPAFRNVGTRGVRFITITSWPDDSKLILSNHFLHLNVIFEKISGLCKSFQGKKSMGEFVDWERIRGGRDREQKRKHGYVPDL